MMTDDCKKSIILGAALQPLFVTTETAPSDGDNMCDKSVIIGILTDDCVCAMITYE